MDTIQPGEGEEGVPLKGGCSTGTSLSMSDYRVRNAISFLAWSDGHTVHTNAYIIPLLIYSSVSRLSFNPLQASLHLTRFCCTVLISYRTPCHREPLAIFKMTMQLKVLNYERLSARDDSEVQKLVRTCSDMGIFFLDMQGPSARELLADLQPIISAQRSFFARESGHKLAYADDRDGRG